MLLVELEKWNVGFAAAALLLVVMLIQHWIRRTQHAKRDFPPMAPVNMMETIHAMSGDDNPFFLLRLTHAMGTSIFRLPLPLFGTPMVAVIGDAKLARDILNDKHTVKPHQTYSSFDYTSNGVRSLFTSSGSYWHARRKGVAPAFSCNHVQRMNAVALAKTDQWIQNRLRPLIEEGKSFDVGDEMIDLLLCSIAETAFEYTLIPSEVSMFKEELRILFREFLFKTNLNPFRRVFGYFLPERHRAHLAAKRIQALSLRIIRAYRSLLNPTKGTIIDLICSNPCYKDDIERTADVTVLLIAGHDTTAYTLAWALKELAQNPDIQADLRHSIESEAVKKGQSPDQLESVRNAVREAIRLHPVSAAGPARTVGRDFTTEDGKLIPAGSVLFLSIISMLRDPNVFGKDYDRFNPSRWEKDNVTADMNQAYLPFAVGRQNCVGQPLAYAELHCILPRIISQFELTVDDPGRAEWFLTLKPAGTMLKAQPVSA